MRLLAILLLVMVSLTTYTQKVLVLEKVGTGRYFLYEEGDDIRLTTVRGAFDISGQIISISDTGFMLLGNYLVGLDDVACIHKGFRNRKANGAKLMVAGGLLVAITSLNNAFHHKPVVDPLYASLGAGLTGAGVIWYTLGTRHYSLSRGWKLKVLDYSWSFQRPQ